MPQRARWVLILMLVGVAIAVATALVLGGTDATDAINKACRDHNGVARIDSGIAICRDGVAVDY